MRAHPEDTVAVNNHSICQVDPCLLTINPGLQLSVARRPLQMYCRDLVGGIHQLEGSLRARPLDHLAEPLMMTLTLMYELSLAGASAEAKRRATIWASAFAPDDFDLSCMRNAG